MTEHLRIRLLGPFSIELDGVPVPDSAWYTRQARQLLKILITACHRTVSTDLLIEWLWPDSPAQAAAVTLRTTASALRHVLEPERSPRAPSRYVITRPPGYAFEMDSSVWIDVVAFDSLIAEAGSAPDSTSQRRALEAALQLYRDDYLVDDPYAEWTFAERERLLEQHLTALTDLAELCATSGEYEQACGYCRRVLTRDPGRELAYRALMLYQARAGDIAGALRTYERCRRNLTEELGADPGPQTQGLYMALLRGEVPSAPGGPLPAMPRPVPPGRSSLPPFVAPFPDIFVGREVEAAFLRQQLALAIAGEGSTVAVEGETGVGKTRLVIDLLQRALESGAAVLSGRCLAVGQPLPYAPLVEALGRLIVALPDAALQQLPRADLAQVAQLLPGLRDRMPDLPEVVATALPAEDRQRLVDSIVRLLVTFAEQHGGLVLFLDDVQWIDDATLTTLARLAPVAGHARLLVVLAYSVEEVGEHAELLGTLRFLIHHHFLHRLTLARLSPLDVGVFVERLIGHPDARLGAFAERLYRVSEGNALFLVETVCGLLDSQGPAGPDALLAAATAGEPSRHIRDVILERLARLPGESRAVLDLAAIIGRDFSLDLLEAASPTDPLPGLEILLRRHFLREEASGRVDFSHQLVRRVVGDDLSALARRRLHRRVADALVALGPVDGAPAAEIAFHYKKAGEGSAQEFLRYAVQAGDDALLAFGFRQGVLHYDGALAVAERLAPDEQVRALIQRAYYGLGSAYEALGDRENLVATYRRMRTWAGRHGDQDMALDASRRIVSSLAVFGYLQESSSLSADLVAQLPPDAPPAVVDLLRRIVLLLRPVEQPPPEASALSYLPPPAVAGAPWDDLVAVLGPQQAVQPLIHYGWTLLTQGQLAPAEACFRRAGDLAAAGHHVASQVTSAMLLSQMSEHQGDWAAMRRWLDCSLSLGQQLPDTAWPNIWTQLFLAFLQLRVGWVGAAEARFQAVYDRLSVTGDFQTHRLTAQVGLGWIALRQSRPARALSVFAEALAEPAFAFAPIYVWGCLGQARAATLLSDKAAARRLVRQGLALGGSRSMPREYSEAAIAAAYFAVEDGHPEKATALLDAAADLAGSAGLAPALLEVQLARSRLLGVPAEAERVEALRARGREQRRALAAAIPHSEDKPVLFARPAPTVL